MHYTLRSNKIPLKNVTIEPIAEVCVTTDIIRNVPVKRYGCSRHSFFAVFLHISTRLLIFFSLYLRYREPSSVPCNYFNLTRLLHDKLVT